MKHGDAGLTAIRIPASNFFYTAILPSGKGLILRDAVLPFGPDTQGGAMGISTIEMKRRHSLPVAEARGRIDRIAAGLREKYGIETSWVGDELTFVGKFASGRISVEPGMLDVFVDLSAVLIPFKAKVKSELRAGIERDFS